MDRISWLYSDHVWKCTQVEEYLQDIMRKRSYCRDSSINTDVGCSLNVLCFVVLGNAGKFGWDFILLMQSPITVHLSAVPLSAF